MKPFAKRRNVCKRKNKTSGRCVTAIIEADQVQLGTEPIYMYSLYYNALQREAGGGSS